MLIFRFMSFMINQNFNLLWGSTTKCGPKYSIFTLDFVGEEILGCVEFEENLLLISHFVSDKITENFDPLGGDARNSGAIHTTYTPHLVLVQNLVPFSTPGTYFVPAQQKQLIGLILSFCLLYNEIFLRVYILHTLYDLCVPFVNK